jgi:hypothetical protein
MLCAVGIVFAGFVYRLLQGRRCNGVVLIDGRHNIPPSREVHQSASIQILSEWLLNSGAYMHWMPA